MSVYLAELGTDWTDLPREEILHRAFALGVEAACGRHHPEEYERLEAAVEGSYDRSLVELAYSEGRQEATRLRRDVGDAEAVWRQLVEAEEGTALSAAVDRTRPASRLDLPSSLSRLELLDRTEHDSRRSLDLPPFLRRD